MKTAIEYAREAAKNAGVDLPPPIEPTSIECKTHGPSLDVGQGCVKCFISHKTPEMIEIERKAKKAREFAKLKKIYNRSGIPERFQKRKIKDYTVESAEQEKAVRVCAEYADNFNDVLEVGRCLLLIGKSGTGKTHLATAIGNELVAKNQTVLYSTIREMIKTIRSSWTDRTIHEKDIILQFTQPDLLILDEVGIQRGSEDEKLLLFDVIDGRYQRKMPTIIISNKTLNVVEDYLGAAAFDRLREGGGKCLVFDWKSHRRK